MTNTISIDARMIDASGIGRYLRSILPHIISANSGTRFVLIGDPEKLAKHLRLPAPNVEVIDCRAPIYSLREQFDLIRAIPKATTIFWSPHYNVPVLYRGRMLVTVHDVFHVAMRDYVPGIHRRLYARIMFAAVRAKADRIISVSRFTRQELQRFVHVSSSKVSVVHNGLDNALLASDKAPSEQGPYFLCVGNVKPHKNLCRVIEAFSSLADKVPHRLVIVGKKEGFIIGDAKVEKLASQYPDRIHFSGELNDAELGSLYRYAASLVFPSLYEGFGYPPLEAMAAGCPAIVSRTAAIPEVCGDAALYCDPYSIEDIAEKMISIISDAGLRESLVAKGRAVAAEFTAEKTAAETWTVIRQLLDASRNSKHNVKR